MDEHRQETEIVNLQSIISDFGMEEHIETFYFGLCTRLKTAHLFSILFPYKNIYLLSAYSGFLSRAQFENEAVVEKELSSYCQWFLKGYEYFQKQKMYDTDIFKIITNFEYDKMPFFQIGDKVAMSGLYDYGKKTGVCYAAWYYALNHQSGFEPLFEKLFEGSSSIPAETTLNTSPQQRTTKQENQPEVESAPDKEQNEYNIDMEMLNRVYNFCSKEDPIFDCSKTTFFTAVAKADFSTVQQKKKTKFKYMIYAIFEFGGLEYSWYSNAVKSIGTTKGYCSGANVTAEWKGDIQNEIKNRQRK